MNAKFFVPFETAKLLKEKGYSEENDYFWDANHLKPRRMASQERSGIQIFSMNNNDVYMLENKPFDSKCFVECTSPTYHEVVDWLEMKGIYINSYAPTLKTEIGSYSAGLYDSNSEYWTSCSSVYPSRENAMNAVILKALEML